MNIILTELEILQDITVKPCREFTAEVNRTMGEPVVTYDKKEVAPQQPKKRNNGWNKQAAVL